MLWVQLSWTICLFGAQLAYTSQNLDEFAFLATPEELSHNSKMRYCAILMNRICKHFQQDEPHPTALQLKQETGIPIRVVKALLNELVELRLLSVNTLGDVDKDYTYQPHSSLEHCNMGKLIDTLDEHSKGNSNQRIQVDELKGKWEDVIKLRKEYINQLHNIPISDL